MTRMSDWSANAVALDSTTVGGYPLDFVSTVRSSLRGSAKGSDIAPAVRRADLFYICACISIHFNLVPQVETLNACPGRTSRQLFDAARLSIVCRTGRFFV